MNNTTWTSEQSLAFHNDCYNALMFHLDGFASFSAEKRDEVQSRLEEQFWLAFKSDDQVDPVTSGAAFRQFIVDVRYNLTDMEVERTLQVSIGRTYAGETVTLSASGEFKLSSPLSVNRAIDALLREIDLAFRYYEVQLPNRAVPSAPEPPRQATPNTLDVIDATRISVTVEGGKTKYRVHGGRWEKYGVALYPEVLQRSGLTEAMIPLSGLVLNGWDATIEMVDDKPRRVKELKQRA